MSQSLVKNHIHIVFATKHRVKVIDPYIGTKLYRYLNGICNNQGCRPELINGCLDHVHILCQLSKTISLSKLIQELKTGSSKWMKTQNENLMDFKWQRGYATFSVQYNNVDLVRRYIANQQVHHQQYTFEYELKKLLSDHEILFDDTHLWD